MKGFFASVLCLFGILMPNLLYAGAGWSQTGKIISVYNLGWTIMVKLDGTQVDYSEGGPCSNTTFYAIDKTNPDFNVVASQIMLAHASGIKTVFFRRQ